MNRIKMKRGKSVAMALGLLALLAVAGESMAAKQPPAQAVDINKAGVEELVKIPGLGAAKAKAIVDFRATSPYKTTSDLVAVKGIGEKLFAKIAPYVTTSGSGQAAPTAEKAAH